MFQVMNQVFGRERILDLADHDSLSDLYIWTVQRLFYSQDRHHQTMSGAERGANDHARGHLYSHKIADYFPDRFTERGAEGNPTLGHQVLSHWPTANVDVEAAHRDSPANYQREEKTLRSEGNIRRDPHFPSSSRLIKQLARLQNAVVMHSALIVDKLYRCHRLWAYWIQHQCWDSGFLVNRVSIYSTLHSCSVDERWNTCLPHRTCSHDWVHTGQFPHGTLVEY